MPAVARKRLNGVGLGAPLAGPAVQRRAMEGADTGPRLTSFADAGMAAFAAGIATRAPDGSYVFHSPGEEPTLQRAGEGTGGTWWNSVTNWWDQTLSGSSPTGGGAIDTAPQSAQPAPPPRPPDQPTPEQTQQPMQTVPVLLPANVNTNPTIIDTGPSTPQAAAAPPPELNLDELARKLYPKLRPYLRRELWIGRERAGSATDRRSS